LRPCVDGDRSRLLARDKPAEQAFTGCRRHLEPLSRHYSQYIEPLDGDRPGRTRVERQLASLEAPDLANHPAVSKKYDDVGLLCKLLPERSAAGNEGEPGQAGCQPSSTRR